MNSKTPASDILLGSMARNIFLAGYQACNPSVTNTEAADIAWRDHRPPAEDIAYVQRLDEMLSKSEETSARIASVAGKALGMTSEKLMTMGDEEVLEMIHALAGSALTQRVPE